MPPFRILRIAKRGLRQPLFPQYRPVRQEQEHDPEKNYTAEDPAWLSEPSSRSSSGSYDSSQAILHPRPRRSSAAAKAYDADKIPRQRFNLYFTLFLGSALVILAMTLTLMGRNSARQVAENADRRVERPAVWETFPRIEGYFGGVRSLVKKTENQAEYPGNSEEVLDEIRNSSAAALDRRDEADEIPSMRSRPFSLQDALQECSLVGQGEQQIPVLHVYDGIPFGFPDSVIGSHAELGLDAGICFDRFGRLGPYGLGYSSKFGGTSAGMEGDLVDSERVWETNRQMDFRQTRWAQAQEQCANSSSSRRDLESGEPSKANADMREPETPSRTVVLIRTWSDYSYDAEDVLFLRALINEVAMTSQGRYTVHFLIHVKDDNLQIWSDEGIRNQILAESLPEEFHGMATLWSSRQMFLLYDGLEDSAESVHSNERATFMPVQFFANEHPEYDFIWNWEIDVRYTGHLRQLLDQASEWSRKQPRKGLWERSARFYVPTDHGSWDDFVQMVRVQSEHGSGSAQTDPFSKLGIDAKSPLQQVSAQKPVWGPLAPESEQLDTSSDPQPPSLYHSDKYEWGTDEDADLITLNPIFNPQGTNWHAAGDVTGYNLTDALPSRRASIGTTVRLSRRLLASMHRETANFRHHMASEMWPASVALHHGFKAAYIPHPVYIDRKWPVDYLAAVFNAGRNGAAGGSRLSVFGEDRDAVFQGTTWYEDAGFAAKLWKRWLGYRVDGEGGEEWELAKEGRMCLPPMLLHPVKQVDLVFSNET